MGGLITIRLLQEERLKLAGVILSSPCLGLMKNPPKLLELASYPLNKIAPTLRVNSGLTIDMATRNADVREMDVNDTLYITKVSVRWFRELHQTINLAFEDIKKVQDVPLLVMQGGDDKIVNKVPVKQWFNKAPFTEKRFKEWPKCYHEIFNEPEREDVFDYAKDFVMSSLRSIGYIV